MNPIDAAHAVVLDYPGGSEALGARIGKAGSTLRQELRQPQSLAKLGLMDAVKITNATDDARIVEAFNEACGYCPPLRLPDTDHTDGTMRELLQRGAVFSARVADAFTEFNDALKDDKVTPNELTKFETAALDAVAAIVVLARSMRSKMETDRSTALHLEQ